MHQGLARWLIERPWRAALACAICGALAPEMLLPFGVMAAAIPVLSLHRHSFQTAVTVAVAGAAATAAVLVQFTPATIWVAVATVLLFGGSVLLGRLVRASDSLNLCFQTAVLGAAAVLVIVHLALPDPVGLWAPLLRQVIESMTAAGFRFEGDQEQLVAMWARSMWGALAALMLAVVFGGVLLGRWWWTLLEAPGRFGAEYRQLRLGATLGVAISVLFVLAMVTESSLTASLSWVAFAALTFQGLSAAHRLKASGRLNRGWLAAIYVLLIVPLSMSITVFILAIWGFADNWLRQRSQRA